MLHLCKVMMSPGIFFHFFKIWIFRVVSGIKGKKNDPKWQKKCLSRSISQEPCIIWFSFMVHLCKMIISPGVVSFFLDFDFLGCSGVKGQKIVQNDKNYVCRAPYLRNHTPYDCHLWYTIVKWWYLQVIFSIFEIGFSCC